MIVRIDESSNSMFVRVQLAIHQSCTNLPAAVAAGTSNQVQDLDLVGRRGHYLNSQAELGRGVLNLLRGSILDSVLTSDARSATLKLVPSSAS